jgi:3,4-dihydroxy 2-butanone 4-phosphate synthase/GTP cyclohydrolase II
MKPAAVICEIMKDDGTMARMPDLEQFSKRHNMPVVSIADLIEFRLLRDSLVVQIAMEPVQTPGGIFDAYCFRSLVDGAQHVALVKGGLFQAEQVVDVRVHRQRPLIDVFSSGETGRRLVDYGLNLLQSSEHAVVLYLSHPGGSQAFVDDVMEMQRPDESTPGTGAASGMNHWRSMDPRLYGIGAQILRQLGIRRMRTHVSTQRSLKGLAGFGLEIVDLVVIPV